MRGDELRLWSAALLALALHGLFMLLVVAPEDLRPPALTRHRSLGVNLSYRRSPTAGTVPPVAVEAPVPVRPKPAGRPEKAVKRPPPEKKKTIPRSFSSSVPVSSPVESRPAPEPAVDSAVEKMENVARPRPGGVQGAVVSQAAPLYRDNPPPVYPRQARRRGWQGVLTLEVLVSSGGEPLEIKLITSSGHRILDQAARDAVGGWRFSPGRRGNEAIEMRVRVPVRFELR